MKMKNSKGFTIIELLVVVGIIGLLASLAVVSFGSAQLRARDGKRAADMKSVLSALRAAAVAESSPLICNNLNAAVSGLTLLSNIKICTGVACNAAACTAGTTDVTTKYINLANVKDPKYPGTACAAVPPAANCDYTMSAAPVPSMAGQEAVFTIGFVTESLNVSGLTQGTTFHTLSESGMQ